MAKLRAVPHPRIDAIAKTIDKYRRWVNRVAAECWPDLRRALLSLDVDYAPLCLPQEFTRAEVDARARIDSVVGSPVRDFNHWEGIFRELKIPTRKWKLTPELARLVGKALSLRANRTTTATLTVDERMQLEFLKDAEGLFKKSQRWWAEKLGCSAGMIAKTSTWKKFIQRYRERDRLEGASSRPTEAKDARGKRVKNSVEDDFGLSDADF